MTSRAAVERIEHEKFCLPRPGATEPRTESYPLPQCGEDGITVIAEPVVSECQECGAHHHVEGVAPLPSGPSTRVSPSGFPTE